MPPLRLIVSEIKHPLEEEPRLEARLRDKLGLAADIALEFEPLRKAIDARGRSIRVVWTLKVELDVDDTERERIAALQHIKRIQTDDAPQPPPPVTTPLRERPIVVGAGPAGLFCALRLTQRGLQPLIVERGTPVEKRVHDVRVFFRHGDLNPESNVQFGEGGAGTFSDGKLTTRIKDPRRHEVLQTLVELGAPEEIRFLARPHLGTDRLYKLVRAMRARLIERGCEIRFQTKLADLEIENGQLRGVVLESAGEREELPASTLFLAIGHGARDTYELLLERGVRFENKPFAVGVRAEHPQEFIDRNQYGKYCGHELLGAADYRLTHTAAGGRGVYSFCMCPGGHVISATSLPGGLVTNGMSNFLRASGFANSGIVVTVGESEPGLTTPAERLRFQAGIERAAFDAAGADYRAPAVRIADYLAGRIGADLPETTYKRGLTPADLRAILPEFIHAPLTEGLHNFDRKIPGYSREGILIGVESRTSSPVRIARDPQTYHSPTVHGVIAVGEGAGFSGGIVSSAVDGMRAAELFDAPST